MHVRPARCESATDAGPQHHSRHWGAHLALLEWVLTLHAAPCCCPSAGAVWAKGLWNRLNGSPGQPFTKDGPFDLPLPVGTEEQRKQALQQLNVQLDALEKQLQVGGAGGLVGEY